LKIEDNGKVITSLLELAASKS